MNQGVLDRLKEYGAVDAEMTILQGSREIHVIVRFPDKVGERRQGMGLIDPEAQAYEMAFDIAREYRTSTYHSPHATQLHGVR